jgi:hypothetical protein
MTKLGEGINSRNATYNIFQELLLKLPSRNAYKTIRQVFCNGIYKTVSHFDDNNINYTYLKKKMCSRKCLDQRRKWTIQDVRKNSVTSFCSMGTGGCFPRG